jgi:hypothetical protein
MYKHKNCVVYANSYLHIYVFICKNYPLFPNIKAPQIIENIPAKNLNKYPLRLQNDIDIYTYIHIYICINTYLYMHIYVYIHIYV